MFKTLLKYQILTSLFLIFYGALHAQSSYTQNWFKAYCAYCSQGYSPKKSNQITAWHNAHTSLENRNYSAANKHILNDQHTNDTVKQLFQNHLLYMLDVENEAKDYLLTLQNASDNNIRQFANKSLGSLYLKNQDVDSADFYFEKAKQVPMPQSDQFLNEITENQAYIYLSNEQYLKAKEAYQQLLRNGKRKRDTAQMVKNYSNLGNLYFEQYKDQLAARYFDSAYQHSKHLKASELKSTVAYNMYIISELSKQHEQAIAYLKEYGAVNESLQKQHSLWQVAQEKEAFNIAQKQTELNLKTAQRNTLLAISMAILVLLAIGFVFYRKLSKQHRQIKQLHQELKETNNVKNQLFTIIAHDLRSPVARLKQVFQIKQLKEKNEMLPADKNVYKIVESLSLLLDNLLNWAMSQADILSVQKEWFPFWHVSQQIIPQYHALIQEKNIQLATDIPKNILVYGDMEIFKIVMRNCIDNAVKFTPEGGNISISGVISANTYTVSIKDSGIGIPEKMVQTLFELNIRKAQKDTSGRKSSGLGLMLTKSMMQLNGGSIHIKNNPTGGTIVNISLPYKNVA